MENHRKRMPRIELFRNVEFVHAYSPTVKRLGVGKVVSLGKKETFGTMDKNREGKGWASIEQERASIYEEMAEVESERYQFSQEMYLNMKKNGHEWISTWTNEQRIIEDAGMLILSSSDRWRIEIGCRVLSLPEWDDGSRFFVFKWKLFF